MVNELHKHYSYNCLSDDDFKLFVEQGKLGTEMSCPCDECGTFYTPDEVSDYHRCNCGNRRCYLQISDSGHFYVEVD